MLGRRTEKEQYPSYADQKANNDSLSTLGSRSPKNTPKKPYSNKQKSELCRKFMQFGYCPYKQKCKFAHGSHELKKNNATNQKYKTKECGAYFKDGFCRFGERCNFLHHHKKQLEERQIQQQALENCREILYGRRNASRLYFMEGR